MKLISHFVAELETFLARCITTGVTEEAKRPSVTSGERAQT
jgi:hypothetical protein